MSDLARLEAAAAGLESLPDDSETADYIGRLDKIIRTLQGHRKTIMDELSGPVSGREYRVVEARTGERSYNTAALLNAFAEKGVALPELVRRRVIDLKWRWSELQREIYNTDIPYGIVPHEIEDNGDIDAPMIGETWKTSYRVEGVK